MIYGTTVWQPAGVHRPIVDEQPLSLGAVSFRRPDGRRKAEGPPSRYLAIATPPIMR